MSDVGPYRMWDDGMWRHGACVTMLGHGACGTMLCHGACGTMWGLRGHVGPSGRWAWGGLIVVAYETPSFVPGLYLNEFSDLAVLDDLSDLAVLDDLSDLFLR